MLGQFFFFFLDFVKQKTFFQASLDEMIGQNPSSILPSYDETALCSAAFRVMRSMVNGWLREVSLYRNAFSDFQISHFYRWIKSSNALLYDPALRRALNMLMRKLFLQIIAEFKRLGAEIIYADFNRVILNSGKKTIVDAISYVDYIVQNIRNKELFHSIQLSYQQCWEFLFWMDTSNFSGVRGKLPRELNVDESQSQTASNVDDEIALDMNWNIGEQLPDENRCREYFEAIMTAYMESLAEYSDPKKAINGISHCAFDAIQKMQKNYGTGREGPALTMINALCKILFVDKSIQDEVGIIFCFSRFWKKK